MKVCTVRSSKLDDLHGEKYKVWLGIKIKDTYKNFY
jgi:hypothetical protein